MKQEGLIDRLAGRTEEEDGGDDDLGGQQHVRQQLVLEDRAPLHVRSARRRGGARHAYGRLARSKLRRTALPRCTALSSACWAVCWPWKAFSISSLIIFL